MPKLAGFRLLTVNPLDKFIPAVSSSFICVPVNVLVYKWELFGIINLLLYLKIIPVLLPTFAGDMLPNVIFFTFSDVVIRRVFGLGEVTVTAGLLDVAVIAPPVARVQVIVEPPPGLLAVAVPPYCLRRFTLRVSFLERFAFLVAFLEIREVPFILIRTIKNKIR